MATGVVTWSKTAASNSNSDTNQNWAEGMSPSAVNDSARAGMASVAMWRDDLNGSLVTSGTSTAYALTTNQSFAALAAGLEVSFQIDEVNGATVTLNVDGKGAKPLRSAAGVELPAGALKAGAVYRATYFTSNSGEWLLQNFTPTIIAADQVVTASIANDAVTLAKIENLSQGEIIARASSGTGDAEKTSLIALLNLIASTARGDVLVNGASGWQRLARGTSGYVLGNDGTDVVWRAPPIFTKEVTSSDLSMSGSGNASFGHGLGAVPKFVCLFLVCQTGEAGYSPGEVLAYGNMGVFNSAGSAGMSIAIDATNIFYQFGSNPPYVVHKTTGNATNLTFANWKLRIKAFA